MGSAKNKKIFEELNTDPYKVLNVSKNCSKQELDLNYHQAYSVLNRLPGQEVQLKLLKQAYKIVESEINTGHTFENKEVYTMKKIDRVYQERSFHKTDFTDYNNRQSLFANDTLNFKEFEKNLNNKKISPTTYTSDNVKGERLFEPGKFNINTFNKHFEENFSLNEESEDLKEAPGIDAFSSMSYMPICSYNGLIIEDNNNSKPFKNLQPLQLDPGTSSKKKKNKKNTVKEEDIKNLYNKRSSETVNVDTTQNFAEINRIMEQKQLENMKSQLEYNKNIVMQNMSVFPQSIIDQFQRGILEDSSTCIDGDSLVIPKGRRRD